MKCPHCKKEIGDPIEQLKSYLEAMIKIKEEAVEYYFNLPRKPLKTGDRRPARAQAELSKWESWLEGIQELERNAMEVKK